MNGLVKTLLVLGIIALAFMGGCNYVKNTFNSMVDKQEEVNKAWSDVESVYQRRADLIPNLVLVVKGAANFEQSTLTAVIEARAKATSITIDPSKATPQQLKQFTEAQQGVQSALSRLMVVVEKYPELKANKNFSDLQVQLEGSENRITVERRKFNDAAREYNRYIRRFPNNFLTGFGNFQPRAYFEADKGAEKAPEIKF
jgi:LemA protein